MPVGSVPAGHCWRRTLGGRTLMLLRVRSGLVDDPFVDDRAAREGRGRRNDGRRLLGAHCIPELLDLVPDRSASVRDPERQRVTSTRPPTSLSSTGKASPEGQLGDASGDRAVVAQRGTAAGTRAEVRLQLVLFVGGGLAIAGNGQEGPVPIAVLPDSSCANRSKNRLRLRSGTGSPSSS